MVAKKAKPSKQAASERRARAAARAEVLRRESAAAAYLAPAMLLWGDADEAAKALGLDVPAASVGHVQALAQRLVDRAEGLSTNDLHKVFMLITSAVLTDIMSAHAAGAIPPRELTNTLLRLQLSRKNFLPEKNSEKLRPDPLVIEVLPGNGVSVST